MKAQCKIVIEYDTAETAKTVLRSVNVDDLDFVRSQVTDNKLEAAITSDSLSSLMHTLDDYLACVSVADKIVNKS
jgi:tRNA threonylcarbamoyladenosine modification (KEOPS) complex  Pcc1 subunit